MTNHKARARQARQTHRRRLAPGRARHQLDAIRPQWMHAWRKSQQRRTAVPGRIKLPKMLSKHRVSLWRDFIAKAARS